MEVKLSALSFLFELSGWFLEMQIIDGAGMGGQRFNAVNTLSPFTATQISCTGSFREYC